MPSARRHSGAPRLDQKQLTLELQRAAATDATRGAPRLDQKQLTLQHAGGAEFVRPAAPPGSIRSN